jgi:hypothetical protein
VFQLGQPQIEEINTDLIQVSLSLNFFFVAQDEVKSERLSLASLSRLV